MPEKSKPDLSSFTVIDRKEDGTPNPASFNNIWSAIIELQAEVRELKKKTNT